MFCRTVFIKAFCSAKDFTFRKSEIFWKPLLDITFECIFWTSFGISHYQINDNRQTLQFIDLICLGADLVKILVVLVTNEFEAHFCNILWILLCLTNFCVNIFYNSDPKELPVFSRISAKPWVWQTVHVRKLYAYVKVFKVKSAVAPFLLLLLSNLLRRFHKLYLSFWDETFFFKLCCNSCEGIYICIKG